MSMTKPDYGRTPFAQAITSKRFARCCCHPRRSEYRSSTRPRQHNSHSIGGSGAGSPSRTCAARLAHRARAALLALTERPTGPRFRTALCCPRSRSALVKRWPIKGSIRGSNAFSNRKTHAR